MVGTSQIGLVLASWGLLTGRSVVGVLLSAEGRFLVWLPVCQTLHQHAAAQGGRKVWGAHLHRLSVLALVHAC